jgi:hypothetical protein
MSPAEMAARQHAQIDSDMLRRSLPEIGEHLAAQMVELYNNPTPERCERMATALEGVKRHTLNLRALLQREAAGGSPTA